jgi:hypothetical protein
MEDDGHPLVFDYEDQKNTVDVEKHQLIRDLFGGLGVKITVCESTPQEFMPYILGYRLSKDSPATFISTFTDGLDEFRHKKKRMFDEANRQKPPPRGAYIGVQFFVNAEGKISEEETADPRVYGPSALSLYKPVYRDVTGDERDAIGIAYYNARMSTNNAALAVATVLAEEEDHWKRFETDYKTGHVFRSYHGMIRAMADSLPFSPGDKLPGDTQVVFAEIALGDGTKKVSSCVPCAIFMQSVGYPASSIHLGRGDNWWIPDSPDEKTLSDWKDTIICYYLSGVVLRNPEIGSYDNKKLSEVVTALITERYGEYIESHIPRMFLEALTFEGSFIDKIKNTLLS